MNIRNIVRKHQDTHTCNRLFYTWTITVVGKHQLLNRLSP